MESFMICSLLLFLGFLLSALSTQTEQVDAAEQLAYDFTFGQGSLEPMVFGGDELSKGMVVEIKIPSREELARYHESHSKLTGRPFIDISVKFFELLRGSKGNIEALFCEELYALEWEAWECFFKHSRIVPNYSKTTRGSDDKELKLIIRSIVLGAVKSFKLADFLLIVGSKIYFSPTKFLCKIFPQMVRHKDAAFYNGFLPRDKNAKTLESPGSPKITAGEFGRLPQELVTKILAFCHIGGIYSVSRTCKAFYSSLRHNVSLKDWHLWMITQRHLFDASSMIEWVLSSNLSKLAKYGLLRRLRFVRKVTLRGKYSFAVEGFPFNSDGGFGSVDPQKLFVLFRKVFSSSGYKFELRVAESLVYSLSGYITRYTNDDTGKAKALVSSNKAFINPFLQFIVVSFSEDDARHLSSCLYSLCIQLGWATRSNYVLSLSNVDTVYDKILEEMLRGDFCT